MRSAKGVTTIQPNETIRDTCVDVLVANRNRAIAEAVIAQASRRDFNPVRRWSGSRVLYTPNDSAIRL
jgi:hypothetical protein